MAARKVLLLGILLLLPVLAFLFLQSFGRNAYKLRTYLPEPKATVQIGAQPVWADAEAAKAAGDTVFHRVREDVRLTSSSGQPFRLADGLSGHLIVLGFTPDSLATAPASRALLRGMIRAQERFRTNADIKLLLLVRNGQQTLPVLAERNGAISGKWIFATSSAPAIDSVRAELRETATAASDDRIWLLDRQRYLRGIYDAKNPREVDRLLTEIDVLLKIEQNPARR